MQNNIKKFDFLFIDEAGQVPIANLIGMSRIAKDISNGRSNATGPTHSRKSSK